MNNKGKGPFVYEEKEVGTTAYYFNKANDFDAIHDLLRSCKSYRVIPSINKIQDSVFITDEINTTIDSIIKTLDEEKRFPKVSGLTVEVKDIVKVNEYGIQLQPFINAQVDGTFVIEIDRRNMLKARLYSEYRKIILPPLIIAVLAHAFSTFLKKNPDWLEVYSDYQWIQKLNEAKKTD